MQAEIQRRHIGWLQDFDVAADVQRHIVELGAARLVDVDRPADRVADRYRPHLRGSDGRSSDATRGPNQLLT